MDKIRPSFKKPKAAQQYLSPEELFAKLPNRATSHGYLRAPQVDALRDYEKLASEPDIAFELPTGTGKTAVGLIIAEWRRRRSGGKVAYLTLILVRVQGETNNPGPGTDTPHAGLIRG